MSTAIFSLAVTEDAQKVNGTAKLGGGEDAEVSNPFYTCTCNFVYFLLLYFAHLITPFAVSPMDDGIFHRIRCMRLGMKHEGRLLICVLARDRDSIVSSLFPVGLPNTSR